MRLYLLDTQVIIWVDHSRDSLSARTWSVLDQGRRCFYSAASAWEAAIKRASGKLNIDEPLAVAAQRLNLEALPITGAHGEEAGFLPMHHRDPFDRILVAQARLEGLVLVTSDTRLRQYDVEVLLVEPPARKAKPR